MTPLRPHQLDAHAFLRAETNGILHHKPGRGKTLSALAWILENARNNPCYRALVIAPNTAVPVWVGSDRCQVSRHWPPDHGFNLLRLDDATYGAVPKRLAALKQFFAVDRPLLAVTNFEAVWRAPLGEWLLAQKWDVVIADELHRFKAPGGKASRWLGRWASLPASRRPQRVGLTGTLLPHSPLDAYGQMRFIDPTCFGTSNACFKARYAELGGFRVNGRPVQVVGYRNMDEFQQKLSKHVHTVGEDDSLPEQVHSECPIPMGAEQKKVYRTLVKEMCADIDRGEITCANALVKMIRLQQITSGFVKLDSGGIHQFTVNPKATWLRGHLEDIPEDENVVVFYKFQHDAELIDLCCGERAKYHFSGARKDFEGKWEPAVQGSVAIVQLDAGSEAIDMTAARYCVFYAQTTKLGQYDQALKRCHREGQERTVTYFHALCENSIDGDIYDALRARRDINQAVLDGVKYNQRETF